MKFFRIRKNYFIFLLVFCGCSQNLLTELGSKSSDEALLEDAQKAVNAEDYQTAIDIILQKVSASGRSSALAKEILASGYAGKCGLNFISFVNGLSAAGNVSAFKLVTTPFVGRAVDSASCLSSLNTLESIGSHAVRSTNQNAFAAVVGMSLMGSVVRETTDSTPVNGDGAEDAANISCTLTDAQIDLVILGFGFMSQNFASLTAAQIGAGSQSTLSTVINKCTTVAGASCSIIDPAGITTPLRDTMRDFLNTTEYGVGSYSATSDVLIPGSCP